jgi:hypothetical protein
MKIFQAVRYSLMRTDIPLNKARLLIGNRHSRRDEITSKKKKKIPVEFGTVTDVTKIDQR